MANLDLTALRGRAITDLVEMARRLDIDNAGSLRKQELIFEIVRRQSPTVTSARGSGVLETLPDGFGFLRSPECNYQPGPDDIYVSPSQIRRFNLRTGDLVDGRIRAPKEGERYFALIKIEEVNGRSPEIERDKLLFDNLTAVHPTRGFALDTAGAPASVRAVDLLAPLAFGQRVLVRAPQRSGRSTLLRELVTAVRSAHPDVHVMVLLVDERPEEVTDLREVLDAEVISSTIDEQASRHVQVAEIGLERARRLVEQGRDVLVVLDSLSRLARAYEAVVPAGGRLLYGSIDAAALHRVRRCFAEGRDLREAGSLTLIATVLADEGARADEVLVDELSASANSEIVLSQALADRGRFPAIEPSACKVRRADRFLSPAALRGREALRMELREHGAEQALELLLEKLRGSPTNEDLLRSD